MDEVDDQVGLDQCRPVTATRFADGHVEYSWDDATKHYCAISADVEPYLKLPWKLRKVRVLEWEGHRVTIYRREDMEMR
jgi:hypothetical protein